MNGNCSIKVSAFLQQSNYTTPPWLLRWRRAFFCRVTSLVYGQSRRLTFGRTTVRSSCQAKALPYSRWIQKDNLISSFEQTFKCLLTSFSDTSRVLNNDQCTSLCRFRCHSFGTFIVSVLQKRCNSFGDVEQVSMFYACVNFIVKFIGCIFNSIQIKSISQRSGLGLHKTATVANYSAMIDTPNDMPSDLKQIAKSLMVWH